MIPARKQETGRRRERGAATPELLVERRGAISLFTLARPERRNCLSEAMLGALQGAIDGAARDPQVRAVVIAAKGSVFCAGHDLDELTRHRSRADGGRAYFALIMHRCAAMMRAIIDCPKPFIAAVEGPALAAGCQLVATCDLAVASDRASFCTPGVDIGLFCSTPMVALSRNVARKRAMEMLLTGDRLAAHAAMECGLVNRVVPAATALDASLALAERIAAKPAATVAIGKAAFYKQIEMPLAAAYDHAAGVMVESMLSAEAAEGIGAFLQKRAPLWNQR
jgi:enoyl-CoA hydratase/carnithine racemase